VHYRVTQNMAEQEINIFFHGLNQNTVRDSSMLLSGSLSKRSLLKGQNYFVYLTVCQTKCNKYALNIVILPSLAICFTDKRTVVECFTTIIHAVNVFVERSVSWKVFCHCNDTSSKAKEDCFPVWNADKIDSITYSYDCRSRILRRKKHTVSTFGKAIEAELQKRFGVGGRHCCGFR
jgi:hypothetical protein